MYLMPTNLRRALFVLTTVLAALTLSACGGDGLPVELTAQGAEGREIANASGCASCHGKNGQGVTAPTWQGLYGGPRELQDGTIVTADDEYLYNSIVDPQAQIAKDYTIKMPQNDLTDDQIELVITYIRELG